MLNSKYIMNWLTIVKRLEVADEFYIFINRRFFGVDGPSQHMAAELHVVLSWEQNIWTKTISVYKINESVKWWSYIDKHG